MFEGFRKSKLVGGKPGQAEQKQRNLWDLSKFYHTEEWKGL